MARTMTVEHKAKLQKALRKARAQGKMKRESFKCPYCGSIADAKPFVQHIKSHYAMNGGRLPSTPPEPPIYTSGNDGRNMEDEKKYRARLNAKQKAIYFMAVFEDDDRYTWDAMMDKVEEIVFA